jgi:hypothetical protein
MTWLAQQYDDTVHVVPVHDDQPHVLTGDCWCGALQDADEPRLWMHRDQLDRLNITTPVQPPSPLRASSE